MRDKDWPRPLTHLLNQHHRASWLPPCCRRHPQPTVSPTSGHVPPAAPTPPRALCTQPSAICVLVLTKQRSGTPSSPAASPTNTVSWPLSQPHSLRHFLCDPLARPKLLAPARSRLLVVLPPNLAPAGLHWTEPAAAPDLQHQPPHRTGKYVSTAAPSTSATLVGTDPPTAGRERASSGRWAARSGLTSKAACRARVAESLNPRGTAQRAPAVAQTVPLRAAQGWHGC